MKRLVLAALALAFLTSAASARPHKRRAVQLAGPVQVVEHPAGCPRVAFCACGAAVRIFGKPIKALFAAVTWFRFPLAEPAPNRVAVRPHHVFVLLHQIRGADWLVYDANSGGHLTRVHVRSIVGWTIVNPLGAA